MADEIVLHVTEANYEDTVVKCDKPVLLAIGAPWCIDCKRIEPMFMEYAQKYTEAGLNTKFRVRHIPTLLLIRKGEILDTLVEPKKVEAFDEFVQKALKEI